MVTLFLNPKLVNPHQFHFMEVLKEFCEERIVIKSKVPYLLSCFACKRCWQFQCLQQLRT